MSDLIFDIKEFALHDGAGLRTTVFFKGCPMRCVWCHNPESHSFFRQTAKNESKCVHCGLCERKCSHEECKGLGVCVKVCPNNCVRAVGEEFTPEKLVETLNKNRYFIKKGGVTFSGGEPLCHTDFILKTIPLLGNIKTAVETCGYADKADFIRAIDALDDIFMDIKLIDEAEHIKYTGKSNKIILENAGYILSSGRKATFRVPLIPGITDTDENLTGIAEFLKKGRENIKVELIPYNRLTGAKYKSVGREYNPPFDETAPLNKNTGIFEKNGIHAEAF